MDDVIPALSDCEHFAGTTSNKNESIHEQQTDKETMKHKQLKSLTCESLHPAAAAETGARVAKAAHPVEQHHGHRHKRAGECKRYENRRRLPSCRVDAREVGHAAITSPKVVGAISVQAEIHVQFRFGVDSS